MKKIIGMAIIIMAGSAAFAQTAPATPGMTPGINQTPGTTPSSIPNTSPPGSTTPMPGTSPNPGIYPKTPPITTPEMNNQNNGSLPNGGNSNTRTPNGSTKMKSSADTVHKR
jgi:hypothetical protein